jgi:dienelactone hydrolase
VVAYLVPPKDVPPPWQGAVWFAGSNILFMRDTEQFVSQSLRLLGFVPRSGRMLVIPIVAGTFERNADGLTQRRFGQPAKRRDLIFEWQKDFGRTLDYLDGRGDVQMNHIALIGLSLGALLAPTLTMGDGRFGAMLLWSGGLVAGGDPDLLRSQVSAVLRTRIPTLTLNGRYDHVFPYETHQLPFFEMLGSSPEDKRQVVYEAGHFAFPLGEAIRENVAWLDQHFGPPAGGGDSRPAAMTDVPPGDAAAP